MKKIKLFSVAISMVAIVLNGGAQNTPTMGTSVQLDAAAGSGINRTCGVDNDQFLAFWWDTDSDESYARVGTISAGNTITLGTAETLVESDPGVQQSNLWCAKLSQDVAVLVWENNGTQTINAVVATVSGTGTGATVTLGNINNTGLNASTNTVTVDRITDTKFVIGFEYDNGSSDQGATLIGDVTGTGASATITFGAIQPFTPVGHDILNTDVLALSASQFVVTFENIDGGAGQQGGAVVGTVSGNTVTYSAIQIFEGNNLRETAPAFLSSTKFMVAFLKDTTVSADEYVFASVGSVSGTGASATISFTSRFQLSTVGPMESTELHAEYLSNNTIIVGWILNTPGLDVTEGVVCEVNGTTISKTGVQTLYADPASLDSDWINLGAVNDTTFVVGTEHGAGDQTLHLVAGNVTIASACTDPDVPTVSATPSTICEGNSTTINISGNLNDASDWEIYTGSCSGTNVGSGTSLLVSPATTTTYFVRGEGGCVVPGTCGQITINVTATPSTPTISAGGPTTFCAGGSVTLTSSSASGNQWYLDGNPIGGEVNQTYIATTSGDYTVIVTTSGCPSAPSSATTVTVNSIPSTPTISAGGPTTFCTGGSVTLTSSSANGNQWYESGNPIGGEVNQTYIATTAGNYTVIVTTSGCPSAPSSATTVTVNPLDDASFNYSGSTYCQSDTDPTATITGETGGTFTSSPAGLDVDPNSGQIDVSNSATGSYTVTYTTQAPCSQFTNQPITIQLCTTTQLRTIDCGATLTSLNQFIYADAVPTAEAFQFKFEDASSGAIESYIRQDGVRMMKPSWINQVDYGLTFNVTVRVRISGVWGNFGPVCSVTMPALVNVTQLQTTDCGATLASMDDFIVADMVLNTTAYQFRFTEGANTYTYIRNDGNNSIKPSWVTGLLLNTTYNVDVRAKYNSVWGNYGPVCTLTTPSTNTTATQLTPTYCNTTQNVGSYVYCDFVSGAEKYQFRYVEQGVPTNVLVDIVSTNKMKPSWLGSTVANVTYDVEVRARIGGVWGPYGTTCTITVTGAAMPTAPITVHRDLEITNPESALSISGYPNPTNGIFNVDLGNNSGTVNYIVTSFEGKTIRKSQTNDQLLRLDLTNESNGIYFLIVNDNKTNATLKIIKR
jgi:hypothetical protein